MTIKKRQLSAGTAEVAALAYITERGRDYYQLGEVPKMVPTEITFDWSATQLRYTSVQGVTAVHLPYGPQGEPFGNGRLYFFRYCHNTDPGTSAQPVNRVSVLGLDRRGGFGFFREVDYVDYLAGQGAAPEQGKLCDDAGNDLPPASSLGVEIWASSSGVYRHELVIEAGSPTALL